jgi:hypothetical protein
MGGNTLLPCKGREEIPRAYTAAAEKHHGITGEGQDRQGRKGPGTTLTGAGEIELQAVATEHGTVEAPMTEDFDLPHTPAAPPGHPVDSSKNTDEGVNGIDHLHSCPVLLGNKDRWICTNRRQGRIGCGASVGCYISRACHGNKQIDEPCLRALLRQAGKPGPLTPAGLGTKPLPFFKGVGSLGNPQGISNP